MTDIRELMTLLESIDAGEPYKKNGITVIDIEDFVDTGEEQIEETYPEYPEDCPQCGADLGGIRNGMYCPKGCKLTEAPGDMLGITSSDLEGQELQDYLDRIKNKEKSKADKFSKPYIHGGNIEIVDDKSGKKYDTDKLMALVKERPKVILKQNQKMQHSDGTSSVFYNVGLPALKGLAVDESRDKFIIANTCPGAGECKTFCYAMKGGYVQWKAVSMGQSRMLNFLINDPKGFAAQMKSELQKAEKKALKKNDKVIVRWHDAGDFFSPEYLALAYDIARSFPKVDFYAYTKIANVAQGAKPDNFLQNFSQGALRSQEKQIDFKTAKHSSVVPKNMFFDLIAKDGAKLLKDESGAMQFASKQNLETFKQRLATAYKIDSKSILTYNQMMATPIAADPKPIYNVIVMPGNGDDSANRKDVHGSYLLFH